MGLSQEEVSPVRERFSDEYRNEEYGEFIQSIGIGKVGEDHCIHVTLNRPLPAHLTLPKKYDGVVVVTDIDNYGPILPLAP